jgi:hypothetical protein
MYQLIANDSWMISENCPEALNAVPAAQYDKDGSNIEDICKTDHLYDDVIDELALRPAVDAEQQEQAICGEARGSDTGGTELHSGQSGSHEDDGGAQREERGLDDEQKTMSIAIDGIPGSPAEA